MIFSRKIVLGMVVVACLFYFTTQLLASAFTNFHDSLNRLTNAEYSDGSRESYSYDQAGNRLSRITSAANTNLDLTPPSTPTNLFQTTSSIGQLGAGWNRAFDSGGSGLSGYRIYVGGNLVTNTTSTNIVLSGLAPDTEYSFSVVAYDRSANTSIQSKSLSLVTPRIRTSPSANAEVVIYPSPVPAGSFSSPYYYTTCSTMSHKGACATLLLFLHFFQKLKDFFVS